MMLPLDAHHRQAARFQLQPLLSRPRQKRLWQQIVQSKITAQARVLTEVQGEDAGLTALAGQVRSGDPNNVEARAARRYWLRLFGDAAFTRQSEFDARNHWLNYGYAVLRAMTSRAICGAGLHPSFGIAHKCASNPFALADDLMEPFRPIIDLVVVRSVGNPPAAVDKSRLLEAVTGRFHADHESRLLFDILARLAQSMAAVVLGEADTLWLPAVSSMEGDHRVSGTLVPKGPASDTALATRRRSVL